MAASRQPADEEAPNRQALSPGLPSWRLLWTPQHPRAQLPGCRGALLSQPPSPSPSLARPRGSGGRGRRAQLTEHPPVCGTGRSAPAACARGRGRHRGREWRCPLRTVGRAGGGDDAAALVSCSPLQPTHVCPAPGVGVEAGPGSGPRWGGPWSVSQWARTRTDAPAAAHGGRGTEAPGRQGRARCHAAVTPPVSNPDAHLVRVFFFF